MTTLCLKKRISRLRYTSYSFMRVSVSQHFGQPDIVLLQFSELYNSRNVKISAFVEGFRRLAHLMQSSKWHFSYVMKISACSYSKCFFDCKTSAGSTTQLDSCLRFKTAEWAKKRCEVCFAPLPHTTDVSICGKCSNMIVYCFGVKTGFQRN